MKKSHCKKKKKEFFKNKLKECIGKPEDLWKAIKSLRLTNKSGGCIVDALAGNQIVKNDTKPILNTFKSFYSNLAEDLLAKLPSCQINTQLYLSLIITKNFHYQKILNWS